jgi:hypothetical protein
MNINDSISMQKQFRYQHFFRGAFWESFVAMSLNNAWLE